MPVPDREVEVTQKPRAIKQGICGPLGRSVHQLGGGGKDIGIDIKTRDDMKRVFIPGGASQGAQVVQAWRSGEGLAQPFSFASRRGNTPASRNVLIGAPH